MEIKSEEGLVRLTDQAIIMEFGAKAMPEKRAVSPRVVPLEHVLEVDYVAPKMLGSGQLRIVMREGQVRVHPVHDTYLSQLPVRKREADAFVDELKRRVDAVEYQIPPASTEPDQVLRKVNWKEVQQETKNANQFGMFEGFILGFDKLSQGSRSWPIGECEASVETGAAVSARVTATRVVAGALAFGKAGAVVGAIAKKDRTKVYLTVTVPGDMILKEVSGLEEAKARKFAAKINNAASAYRANPVGQVDAAVLSAPVPPPPPPVSVPAGWYPQGDVQRYWDGTTWTDHTAPLAPH